MVMVKSYCVLGGGVPKIAFILNGGPLITIRPMSQLYKVQPNQFSLKDEFLFVACHFFLDLNHRINQNSLSALNKNLKESFGEVISR